MAATSANSDWSAVSAATDPTATDFDLDGDGNDYFISFSVDFGTIVQELANLGIGGFDQLSIVNLVAGTSTNASSSMNQDIAGVDGGTDSTTTWGALGALSPPAPIP